MSTRTQWILVGVAVLALASGLFAAVRVFGSDLFPVTLGSKAPDFAGTTIDGRAQVKGIKDYENQVVLLNVWATWCQPCRVEMPSMDSLYRDFGPSGLKVVAVSIDDPGTEKQIRDFAQEYGLHFEILHDSAGSIKKIYQTTGVPESFVIGRDGIIRKKVIGAENWSSQGNRALIAQLLGEGSPAPIVAPATPYEVRDSATVVPVRP